MSFDKVRKKMKKFSLMEVQPTLHVDMCVILLFFFSAQTFFRND